MKEKLKQLMSKCKCGVHISINQHRDYYQSVEQYFKEMRLMNDSADEIPETLMDEMIERDTIIEIQFYPDTPVVFYKIYHWDLDAALDESLME